MATTNTTAKLARVDAEIASLRDRLDNKLTERRELLSTLITNGEALRAEVNNEVYTLAQATTLAETGRCLTADQVREIRKLNKAGVSQSALGRRFGLSQPSIYKIVKRQSYQDVK